MLFLLIYALLSWAIQIGGEAELHDCCKDEVQKDATETSYNTLLHCESHLYVVHKHTIV